MSLGQLQVERETGFKNEHKYSYLFNVYNLSTLKILRFNALRENIFFYTVNVLRTLYDESLLLSSFNTR